MNGDTLSDSEERYDTNPSESIRELAISRLRLTRTVCVNDSWQDTRRLLLEKPADWRKRSRSLFRFMLREEFSCRAFRRQDSAEITDQREMRSTQE